MKIDSGDDKLLIWVSRGAVWQPYAEVSGLYVVGSSIYY